MVIFEYHLENKMKGSSNNKGFFSRQHCLPKLAWGVAEWTYFQAQNNLVLSYLYGNESFSIMLRFVKNILFS